jgi:hypothetical protein
MLIIRIPEFLQNKMQVFIPLGIVNSNKGSLPHLFLAMLNLKIVVITAIVRPCAQNNWQPFLLDFFDLGPNFNYTSELNRITQEEINYHCDARQTIP